MGLNCTNFCHTGLFSRVEIFTFSRKARKIVFVVVNFVPIQLRMTVSGRGSSEVSMNFACQKDGVLQ